MRSNPPRSTSSRNESVRDRGSLRGRVSLPRGGWIPIEFVLILPIIILLVVVVIQISLLLMNWQHVKSATFAGARAAADLTPAQLRNEESVIDGNGVPHTAHEVVKRRIDRTLDAAGLGPSQRVGIEYLQGSGGGDGVAAVRITVVMVASDLSPDLLALFGLPMTNGTTRTLAICPHLSLLDEPEGHRHVAVQTPSAWPEIAQR